MRLIYFYFFSCNSVCVVCTLYTYMFTSVGAHMDVYTCCSTVIITMTKCNFGGKGFVLAYTSRVQTIRRKVRTGTKTETMEEHWVLHKLVLRYHSYTAQAHLPRGCPTHSGLQTWSQANLIGAIQSRFPLPR